MKTLCGGSSITMTEDIDVNDLKTPTQSQKEDKAAKWAYEEENQRRKEAGYRQTTDNVISQLMFRDKCKSFREK